MNGRPIGGVLFNHVHFFSGDADLIRSGDWEQPENGGGSFAWYMPAA
jgi:hypothetical protein